MKFRHSLSIALSLMMFTVNADCKLINQQCIDNTDTKTIEGIQFKLTDVCSRLGLTGDKCCWNLKKEYYCGDASDGHFPREMQFNLT